MIVINCNLFFLFRHYISQFLQNSPHPIRFFGFSILPRTNDFLIWRRKISYCIIYRFQHFLPYHALKSGILTGRNYVIERAAIVSGKRSVKREWVAEKKVVQTSFQIFLKVSISYRRPQKAVGVGITKLFLYLQKFFLCIDERPLRVFGVIHRKIPEDGHGNIWILCPHFFYGLPCIDERPLRVFGVIHRKIPEGGHGNIWILCPHFFYGLPCIDERPLRVFGVIHRKIPEGGHGNIWI